MEKHGELALMDDGKARSADGSVTYERLEPPARGQYWAARRDLERQSTKRAQNPDVEAGTVLLIEDIELASGEPLVIVLAPHPAWPERLQRSLRFHADDFETMWERSLDAAAIRAAELADLAEQMRLTQEAMSRPPEADTPAAGCLPGLTFGREGTELATKEGLQALNDQANKAQQLAEVQVKWIEGHSKTLAAQACAIARFHQEKATALLADAKSRLSDLDGIRSLVTNLEIYTGKGVDVLQLVAGDAAPASEPLTIYQDLLSFDEELLLLLDQDGIDHTHCKQVAEALKDPALLTQMIPSQRGMVLVRFRGREKAFARTPAGAEPEVRAAIGRFNAEMSEVSMRHHLLLRDGASVWLVSCPEVFDTIKHLMPSALEQAEHYTRKHFNWDERKYDYEDITRDDMDYARAQRSQLTTLTSFARVLIVLWGLHDRTDLFEGTEIPKFSNWLDPGFQNRYLNLVSMDTLIGRQRETFGEYRDRMNEFLAAGSIVAVRCNEAINSDTAPGCYWYSQRAYQTLQRWYARDRVAIARVTMVKGVPTVTLPVVQKGYSVREKGVRVSLKNSHAYLVLDRCSSADIGYYLGNRAARKNYHLFVDLFNVAKAYVLRREQREHTWTEFLLAAAIEGGLAQKGEDLDRAVLSAQAVTRAMTSAGTLPEDVESAPRALRQSALAVLHAELADHEERTVAVETLCAGMGWDAIALASRGEGAWVLYREPLPSEVDPRYPVFPWVVVQRMAFNGRHASVVGEKDLAEFRPIAGELVVRTWARSAARDKAGVPGGLTYGRAAELLDLPGLVEAALQDRSGLVDELIEAFIEHNRKDRSRSVARLSIRLPIGVVAVGDNAQLMVAALDAVSVAHAWGDQAQKERVKDWVRRTYAHPERHLAGLEEGLNAWPGYMRLHELPQRIDGLWLTQDWRRMSSEADFRSTEASERRQRIISLTRIGAELMPWMTEFVEGLPSAVDDLPRPATDN